MKMQTSRLILYRIQAVGMTERKDEVRLKIDPEVYDDEVPSIEVLPLDLKFIWAATGRMNMGNWRCGAAEAILSVLDYAWPEMGPPAFLQR